MKKLRESEGASLPVKALYAVYRLWSEERGERPMTQIAFQRKISDRGSEIVGLGSRAEIRGRLLIPRAVPQVRLTGTWQQRDLVDLRRT
jgi:hypothetical protein